MKSRQPGFTGIKSRTHDGTVAFDLHHHFHDDVDDLLSGFFVLEERLALEKVSKDQKE